MKSIRAISSGALIIASSLLLTILQAAAANLAAPTLSAPSNGATGVSTTPAFSWSAVTGATAGYWLAVATSSAALPTDPTDSTGAGCVIMDAVSGTSRTPTTVLNAGTTYYWRVRGRGPGSTYGNWSSIFNFTTQLPAPTMTFNGPNAGATWQVGTSQTVSWSVSGNTSQISYFVVRLSLNNGNSYTDISANLSASARSFNYTPISSQATTTAVCWVNAYNSSGTFLAGAISSGPFTIIASTPALSITTTAFDPATATVGTGYAAQQAVTATGGQTPYSWSASGLPSGMAINSSTGAPYGTPTVSGTFNVTVTVTDSSSPQKTASKALSITVVAASFLPAPTLSAPSNGVTGVSPTPIFSWSAVTGASAGYFLAVATSSSTLPTDPTDSTGAGCVIMDAVSGTSETPSTVLSAGTTYYWRVRGRGPGTIYGNWSSIYSFTTLPTDNTPPTVSVFSVTPSSRTVGSAFTISYTVSDTGGSGLWQMQLWRTTDSGGVPDTSNWTKITVDPLSGNGPFSGSFSDAPPSAGTYWYGGHGVDNALNIGHEPTVAKVIVAPASTTYTLNVASSNPNNGVYIYVGPNDVNGQADGTTSFSRQFNSGTSVTLIAPATAGGNNFVRWTRDGVDYDVNRTTTVTMSAAHTMTAVFAAAPPVTHTVTVASSNPNSGVAITSTTLDNNTQAGGTTTFTRIFNQNATAIYIAPATAGGNNFQKWQRDGSDLTTSTTATITLDADHTLTAVYGGTPALSITTTAFNPATATVGTAYAAVQAVTATGGQTPYSWSASGLPSGMAINSSTGAPYGTPTISGSFNITVTVRDSSSPQKTASKTLTLTVNSSTSALSITSTAFNPSTATVGTGYAANTAVTAMGGQTPYSWSATGLPSGMGINSSSGAVFGTPTAAGTYDVNVTVQDSGSPRKTASKRLALTVNNTTSALSITSTAFNPSMVTVGVGYAANTAVMATGGRTPYGWSATGLPNGMQINSSSGALFGTPTVSGTFNVTVTVTDNSSPQKTASKVLSLTVATVATVALSATPGSMTFVAIQAGRTADRAFTISNLGSGVSI